MEIYRKALEWLDEDRRFSLGVVVMASGSTPQKAGSRALLDGNGTLHGTLGGGLVEAVGLRHMEEVIAGGGARLFEYRLDEAYSREAGPICGGMMRFLADGNVGRNRDAYRAALEGQAARAPGLLVTIVRGADEDVGSVTWVPEAAINGTFAGLDPAALRGCVENEKTLCTGPEGDVEFYVEPVCPLPKLLVVGGGHVGLEVVRQAVLLGFEITVLDDRPEFAQPERFPGGVTALCVAIGRAVAEFSIDPETYIILVSKGHRPDAEALEACIHSNAAFIGMIGSRRKVESLRQHFLEDGLATPEEFGRVVAPIGFDIGAITVAEIGVSIAAQLVAARRRSTTACGALHQPPLQGG